MPNNTVKILKYLHTANTTKNLFAKFRHHLATLGTEELIFKPKQSVAVPGVAAAGVAGEPAPLDALLLLKYLSDRPK